MFKSSVELVGIVGPKTENPFVLDSNLSSVVTDGFGFECVYSSCSANEDGGDAVGLRPWDMLQTYKKKLRF
jgi:hypothetical protein